jgi:2-oxoglutarate dehydrogenase E2 component (dihydrolipoamide succinyltransferase)
MAEQGLDPGEVPATGPGGRITKGDVLEHAAAKPGAAAPPAAPAPAPAPEPASTADAPREQRVRMTRLRRTIAARLVEAQATAAILTTFNEIDMSAVIAARARHKDAFEKKHGVRLGFTSFFAKAVVAALREVPEVNAEIDGEEIVYKNYYDLGMAVSAPTGLVVPVIRDCDRKSFAEIEAALADLAERARDGKLSPDEMRGGTFTISNGGVFGSLLSTPILNRPQSGILGLHKIEDRPIALDGQVVIRPMMYVALSYDHRLVDGREAVTFLVRVKQAIEDPERLLLDV